MNKYQKVLTIYFLLTFILWIGINLSPKEIVSQDYWYSFLYALTALYAGVVGMLKASMWGGLKSALGRAVFFISLGLLLWGVGESIWSYYNFFENNPAPYPSLADIGFASSIFFWIIGIGFLAKATGAWFVLKESHKTKFLVILSLVALIIPSYYIQIHIARGGVLLSDSGSQLKTFLDIIYPFSDFLAIMIASTVYVLSNKYFGGIYKSAVSFLLAGLSVMYISDTSFSYTTTKATYHNGNWVDVFFSIGLFLIAYGVLAFATIPQTQPDEERI